MEKIQWLRQMAAKHPEDAQTHFWLGKELAENGLWLEAISSYSAGLTYCENEELRNDFIRELSLATQQLQQQATGSAAAPAVQKNSSAASATGMSNVAPLAKGMETENIGEKNEAPPKKQIIKEMAATIRCKMISGKTMRNTMKPMTTTAITRMTVMLAARELERADKTTPTK